MTIGISKIYYQTYPLPGLSTDWGAMCLVKLPGEVEGHSQRELEGVLLSSWIREDRVGCLEFPGEQRAGTEGGGS